MSDEPKNRRAEDAHQVTLVDVVELLNEMKANQQGYMSAFVLDDLGKPDYTGHRLAHKAQIAAAAANQQYKTGLTRTMIDWAAKGLAGVIVLTLINGGMTYIAQHIK